MPDLGEAADAFFRALQQILPQLMAAATDSVAKLLIEHADASWQSLSSSLVQSDLNFITRTPPRLSYNFGGVMDFYHQYDAMYFGLGALAFVFAGLASFGRMYLGWGWTPSETFLRVGLGIAFATSTPHLYQWSMDFNNRICDAIIGANLPGFNQPENADPLTMAVIIPTWVILGMRVAWRMGYRLIYLDVLLIVGPVALAAWMIPGGESYARWWTRTFVGLLLGQELVSLCFRLAGGLGGELGSSLAGLALGIGALLLAYDMATLFADIRGGGLSGIVAGAAKVVAMVV